MMWNRESVTRKRNLERNKKNVLGKLNEPSLRAVVMTRRLAVDEEGTVQAPLPVAVLLLVAVARPRT
jgi:hypothetical protein